MSNVRGQSSLFIVSYFPFADYEIQFTLNLSNVNKLKMWSRHNAFNDNLEISRRTFIYNKPNFTTVITLQEEHLFTTNLTLQQ